MPLRPHLCLAITVFLQPCMSAGASEVAVSSYDDITEITVTVAPRLSNSGLPDRTIDGDDFVSLSASTAADVFNAIPGARVQINSRGESLVYLRNAGERQVAVYFDGALLNVPWDNRADLSLIPTAIMSGLTVRPGVTTVAWGANTSGGVVNFTGPSWNNAAPADTVSLSFGSGGMTHLSGSARFGGRDRGLFLAGDRFVQDFEPLPAHVSLPYNQEDPDRRTNTDRRMSNLLARGTLQLAPGWQMGLSLLYLDGVKGVAPEGHKDPTQSRVRFWRYPKVRNVTTVINLTGTSGSDTRWQSAFWYQDFDQQIQSFGDAGYARPLHTQSDGNATVGGRIMVDQPALAGRIRVSTNFLSSKHSEQKTGPKLQFRQVTSSLGIEYFGAFGETTEWGVGAGLDHMSMPRTGDKEARDSFTTHNLTAFISHRSYANWTLSAAIARKTRLPTLRELFGEALGRFLINPDLVPETSYLGEARAHYQSATVRFSITPFLNATDDTIDQRSVMVGGTALRQRVNLRGSRAYGVDIEGSLAIIGALSVEGHMTLMRLRSRNAGRLTERPEVMGRLGLNYAPDAGPTALVEIQHRGRAYGLEDDGSLTSLPASNRLNARLSVPIGDRDNRVLTVFLKGGNLLNTVTLPQLGLPQPGRTIEAGLRARF